MVNNQKEIAMTTTAIEIAYRRKLDLGQKSDEQAGICQTFLFSIASPDVYGARSPRTLDRLDEDRQDTMMEIMQHLRTTAWRPVPTHIQALLQIQVATGREVTRPHSNVVAALKNRVTLAVERTSKFSTPRSWNLQKIMRAAALPSLRVKSPTTLGIMLSSAA